MVRYIIPTQPAREKFTIKIKNTSNRFENDQPSSFSKKFSEI
jgi:hypothetical protein